MRKYAICSGDLNEIEQHLNTTDCNENLFDFRTLNYKMKLKVLRIYIQISMTTMICKMTLVFHQHHLTISH